MTQGLPATPPPLVRAYLHSDPLLQPLYAHSPNQTDWAAAMQAVDNQPLDRPRLVYALREQMASRTTFQPLADAVEALLQPHTYAIVTGQQAGLAGGPLYTWYKAITAIKWSRTLQHQYPQSRFVPVFWVAGEDHDAEEIDHCWLNFFDKKPYKGSINGPVGRHRTVADMLPEIPEVYRQYWQQTPTWGQAFAQLLHDLLGPQGLVVLDADSRLLKEAFVPHMQAELSEGKAAHALKHTTEVLSALGYRPQLHIRDCNLFYQQEGLRERLETAPDGYRLADSGALLSTAAVEQLLHESPEALSPNAAMRPLYQQTILPCVAYIGGYGEMAYWLQLKGMFDAYGLPYPVLLPRLQALALPAEVRAQLGALQLDVPELLMPPERLRQLLLPRVWDPEPLNQHLTAIALHYSQAADLLSDVAQGQERTAHSGEKKYVQWARRLQHQVAKEVLKADPVYQQALRLQRRLQPAGLVQERVLCMAALGGNPQQRVQEMMAQLSLSAEKVQFWHPDSVS